MTLEIDVNTLIATIIAAVIIGIFWRIFNIPEKYMSKKECERRRDGDGQAIQIMAKSVATVHKRVDEIHLHLIGKKGGGKE